MLEAHLTRADTEQYLLGALPPEAAAKLEAHTLACDPCALLLQEEALLEEQLREVAASAPPVALPVPRPARWRRVAAAAVGPALAAAAAVAFLVLRPVPVGPASAPRALEERPLELPRVVACLDVVTQEACAETAAARGLLVQFPRGVGEVPRYDGYAGLPATALATHPASL
jgi:anti-sigma factor RsiW